MSINNNPFSNLPFSPQTGVRKPVPLVSIGGVPLPGVISAEATNASHFAADHFRVELALSGLPAGLGVPFWESVGKDTLIDVSIGMQNGFVPSVPSSLVVGAVDDVDVDLVKRTVSLTGRDLSSRFIDNKTAETFKEQTASQIATILAGRRGLQANVKATATPVGQYYEFQHARLNNDRTEWDLLVELAQHEQYDVWVSGQVLNFQPKLSADTAQPYVLAWQEIGHAGNFEDLQLKRSLTLANDVIVKVKSWNQKQKAGFTKTARGSKSSSAANKGNQSGGTVQTYEYRIPNLTPEQAQARANALLEDLSRHERVITARLPGDTTLNTRMMLSLTGTGSSFDQLYYPDTVTRRISFDQGFVMDVTAKNHSTQVLTFS